MDTESKYSYSYNGNQTAVTVVLTAEGSRVWESESGDSSEFRNAIRRTFKDTKTEVYSVDSVVLDAW